ncbi:MAG: hypothetical protein J0L81_06555, partial [Caulobacterales bacterium]|nr:hypothetical protein [Caulobacterales bacterium]
GAGGGDVGRDPRLPKIARNRESQKLMLFPHFSVFAASRADVPRGANPAPGLNHIRHAPQRGVCLVDFRI